MRNRQLVVPGVFLSDVVDTLNRQGIPLTEENIMAFAVKVQVDAHAMATATLQEMDRETALEYINLFREDGKEDIKGNPVVKSGTYIGEKMRPIPETISLRRR